MKTIKKLGLLIAIFFVLLNCFQGYSQSTDAKEKKNHTFEIGLGLSSRFNPLLNTTYHYHLFSGFHLGASVSYEAPFSFLFVTGIRLPFNHTGDFSTLLSKEFSLDGSASFRVSSGLSLINGIRKGSYLFYHENIHHYKKINYLALGVPVQANFARGHESLSVTVVYNFNPEQHLIGIVLSLRFN